MSISRAIWSCLGFVLLQIVSGPIWAASNNELRPRDSFTAQVLADRVDLGNRSDASQGGVNLQIHLNFSKVVEQNFAMLDEGATTRIVNGLTHRELTDLAQLYVNSVADGGRRGLLLQILSTRLDANALARLSRYFGYDGTLSAIQEAAPSKALAFALAVGGGVVAGPVPGVSPVTTVGRTIQGVSPVAQYINWSPTEIYLDLRTAPLGSLTVAGALYETGSVLATSAGIAFGVGYTAGSAAAYLVQTYDPALWQTIGGTVATAVTNIQTAATEILQGQFEQAMGTLFGLNSTQRSGMSSYGGDYDNSQSWCDFATYSGGCLINSGCGGDPTGNDWP